MVFIVALIGFSIAAYLVWVWKGYNGWIGVGVGLLITPIGSIIVGLCVRPKTGSVAAENASRANVNTTKFPGLAVAFIIGGIVLCVTGIGLIPGLIGIGVGIYLAVKKKG